MKYLIARNSIPALCLAATALAQQPTSPPPPPPQANQPGDPPPRDDRRPVDERRRGGGMDFSQLREASRDPKALGDMLDRMLEQNGRIERRLTDAKEKLDAGASPEEVFRMLREARAGDMAGQFFQNWRERQRDDQDAQGPMFEKQPGGHGGPGGGGGGPDPQQREELLKFIREVRPEFASKLEQWQKDEPKAFGAVIGHLFMQGVDTFRERDRDAKLYELRKEDLRASILIVEKSTELRRVQIESKGQPESQEFVKAKAELRDLMGKGYDSRVRVREYEAERLAKRLDETRARIQETKDVREQMLDKAVQQLLERKRPMPQPGDGPGEPGGRRPEPGPR
ncbi:MAG: hypothetical protein ACREJD_17135 [Phycisphaerales bacterium]